MQVDAFTMQVAPFTMQANAFTMQVDAFTIQVDAFIMQVDALWMQVDALIIQVSCIVKTYPFFKLAWFKNFTLLLVFFVAMGTLNVHYTTVYIYDYPRYNTPFAPSKH
jgi:hypothetical protein